MKAAAASGDASAVIHLLPRVFEFVFSQMEEIKRDSANAHIRLIAPYLARHGAAYERAKFEVRCGAVQRGMGRLGAVIVLGVLIFALAMPARQRDCVNRPAQQATKG